MTALIPARPDGPLKVGLSHCLTGAEVRYDGTGAKSSLPHAELQGLFEFSSVCPEMGIGMSSPRPPIRLVTRENEIRAVGVADPSLDVTEKLRQFADNFDASRLSGVIFMHNSPSCGVYRVKVYNRPDAPAERSGRGLFAARVMEKQPLLPVEDAGRLFDDVLRENFVTRAFAYAHWCELEKAGLNSGALIAFHSAYKYLLLAHDQAAYKACGALLSNLKTDFEAKAQEYIALLMAGLTKPATRKGHANVLSHMQGYFKRNLDSNSRQELDRLIQAYRRGEQPLLAPLALLRHHLQTYPDDYLSLQTYLEPHPPAAGLRRSL